jgi:NAD(P)-dependent dehydrogenase (short-subunit alcohol dehydrogenase family)
MQLNASITAVVTGGASGLGAATAPADLFYYSSGTAPARRSHEGDRRQGTSREARHEEAMTCWPVSARVGNVKNNDPSPIEPIADDVY